MENQNNSLCVVLTNFCLKLNVLADFSNKNHKFVYNVKILQNSEFSTKNMYITLKTTNFICYEIC